MAAAASTNGKEKIVVEVTPRQKKILEALSIVWRKPMSEIVRTCLRPVLDQHLAPVGRGRARHDGEAGACSHPAPGSTPGGPLQYRSTDRVHTRGGSDMIEEALDRVEDVRADPPEDIRGVA